MHWYIQTSHLLEAFEPKREKKNKWQSAKLTRIWAHQPPPAIQVQTCDQGSLLAYLLRATTPSLRSQKARVGDIMTPTEPAEPWKHPDELPYIRPAWSESDFHAYLLENAFSVPARTHRDDPWCAITLPPSLRSKGTNETGAGSESGGAVVLVPKGYRLPLMFAISFQWESLKLVMTSKVREEEWEDYKWDILHVSRLCHAFLEGACKAGGRGTAMDKMWRCPSFDRAITRYYRRWLVNRDEFLQAFWEEFGQEEYEEDVLKKSWMTFVLKGHKGFRLEREETVQGLKWEEMTRGLALGEDGKMRWILSLVDAGMNPENAVVVEQPKANTGKEKEKEKGKGTEKGMEKKGTVRRKRKWEHESEGEPSPETNTLDDGRIVEKDKGTDKPKSSKARNKEMMNAKNLKSDGQGGDKRENEFDVEAFHRTLPPFDNGMDKPKSSKARNKETTNAKYLKSNGNEGDKGEQPDDDKFDAEAFLCGLPPSDKGTDKPKSSKARNKERTNAKNLKSNGKERDKGQQLGDDVFDVDEFIRGLKSSLKSEEKAKSKESKSKGNEAEKEGEPNVEPLSFRVIRDKMVEKDKATSTEPREQDKDQEVKSKDKEADKEKDKTSAKPKDREKATVKKQKSKDRGKNNMKEKPAPPASTPASTSVPSQTAIKSTSASTATANTISTTATLPKIKLKKPKPPPMSTSEPPKKRARVEKPFSKPPAASSSSLPSSTVSAPSKARVAPIVTPQIPTPVATPTPTPTTLPQIVQPVANPTLSTCSHLSNSNSNSNQTVVASTMTTTMPKAKHDALQQFMKKWGTGPGDTTQDLHAGPGAGVFRNRSGSDSSSGCNDEALERLIRERKELLRWRSVKGDSDDGGEGEEMDVDSPVPSLPPPTMTQPLPLTSQSTIPSHVPSSSSSTPPAPTPTHVPASSDALRSRSRSRSQSQSQSQSQPQSQPVTRASNTQRLFGIARPVEEETQKGKGQEKDKERASPDKRLNSWDARVSKALERARARTTNGIRCGSSPASTTVVAVGLGTGAISSSGTSVGVVIPEPLGALDDIGANSVSADMANSKSKTDTKVTESDLRRQATSNPAIVVDATATASRISSPDDAATHTPAPAQPAAFPASTSNLTASLSYPDADLLGSSAASQSVSESPLDMSATPPPRPDEPVPTSASVSNFEVASATVAVNSNELVICGSGASTTSMPAENMDVDKETPTTEKTVRPPASELTHGESQMVSRTAVIVNPTHPEINTSPPSPLQRNVHPSLHPNRRLPPLPGPPFSGNSSTLEEFQLTTAAWSASSDHESASQHEHDNDGEHEYDQDHHPHGQDTTSAHASYRYHPYSAHHRPQYYSSFTSEYPPHPYTYSYPYLHSSTPVPSASARYLPGKGELRSASPLQVDDGIAEDGEKDERAPLEGRLVAIMQDTVARFAGVLSASASSARRKGKERESSPVPLRTSGFERCGDVEGEGATQQLTACGTDAESLDLISMMSEIKSFKTSMETRWVERERQVARMRDEREEEVTKMRDEIQALRRRVRTLESRGDASQILDMDMVRKSILEDGLPGSERFSPGSPIDLTQNVCGSAAGTPTRHSKHSLARTSSSINGFSVSVNGDGNASTSHPLAHLIGLEYEIDDEESIQEQRPPTAIKIRDSFSPTLALQAEDLDGEIVLENEEERDDGVSVPVLAPVDAVLPIDNSSSAHGGLPLPIKSQRKSHMMFVPIDN